MSTRPQKVVKKKAPSHLPIMNGKIERPGVPASYEEKEITREVLLCDKKGNLNPQAVGWSRVPLVTANLRGHWPRKKKWNFWNWMTSRFVFSITIADIDLACFCAVSFIDFKTKESFEQVVIRPSGWVKMPDRVDAGLRFTHGPIRVYVIEGTSATQVYCSCSKGLLADFEMRKPRGHETLNVVVPWTEDRFQLNSKHNTLPTEGFVTWGKKRYIMDPKECHGVQDFGRGMWPYRSYWNWGAGSGEQDGVLIGVNMGAKWTTGTGSNENGICIDGKLFKIMEDLVWTYDLAKPMAPWRVKTAFSDSLDLTLKPFYERKISLDFGLIGSRGSCVFGLWEGTLNIEDRTIGVRALPGWAEDFSHKW